MPDTSSCSAENALGSPFGSAYRLTVNPDAGRRYANEFSQTTVRDDVGALRRPDDCRSDVPVLHQLGQPLREETAPSPVQTPWTPSGPNLDGCSATKEGHGAAVPNPRRHGEQLGTRPSPCRGTCTTRWEKFFKRSEANCYLHWPSWTGRTGTTVSCSSSSSSTPGSSPICAPGLPDLYAVVCRGSGNPVSRDAKVVAGESLTGELERWLHRPEYQSAVHRSARGLKLSERRRRIGVGVGQM
ncbi:hypothetical protein LZ31DRAFT_343616, partial [Colletotrichum somersetense]